MDKARLSLDVSKEGLNALQQLLVTSLTALSQQERLILTEMENTELKAEELQHLNDYVLNTIIPQIAIGEEILRAINETNNSRIIIPA